MADPALSALSSLVRGAKIHDHTEALKVADAAIRAAKSGRYSKDLVTAQLTRLVSLLKLDRFDDALRTIADGGQGLEKLCVREKAYALYKTGDLEAAESCLEQIAAELESDRGRGSKHVAAQVAYRAEKFERAAELYRELAKTEDGKYGEENDVRINLLATYAQLEWLAKGWAVPEPQKQPGRDELEAFETAYNAGCGCLARNDLSKAAVLLKRSRDLCEASDELSEEDKAAELVPIVIQQAYVCSRSGKVEEAASLLKSLPLSSTDPSTKSLARNNSLVVQIESNAFLAQRHFHSLPKISGNDRLFDFQASILSRNQLIIELQAQKFSGVAEKTARLLSKSGATCISPHMLDLGILNAAATCQLQSGKEAIRKMSALFEKRPYDLGLLLTLIQLYVRDESPGPALAALEAFFNRLDSSPPPHHADVRFAPGLVALAVGLYRLQNRPSALRTELAKAAAYWQEKIDLSSVSRAGSLLREAGIELLHSPNPDHLLAAGKAFSRLVAARPDDGIATAGLVASLVIRDPAAASPYLDSLRPVDGLTTGVDVAALIAAGIATPPVTAAAANNKKRSLDEVQHQDQGLQQRSAVRKAKRRRRLPKDYDPDKTPDPERWLPLRDRSTYRPKGRKGKRRAAEATQGGIVRGDDEMLELAGGAGSVKVEKAIASGGTIGSIASKKKKKGGRK